MSEELKNEGEDPDWNDNPEMSEDDTVHHGRRRVKVRKRIRVKKKRSPKRKLKKFFEKVVWAAIIIGFIVSLVILIKQLDISDKSYKKKKADLNKLNHEFVLKGENFAS